MFEVFKCIDLSGLAQRLDILKEQNLVSRLLIDQLFDLLNKKEKFALIRPVAFLEMEHLFFCENLPVKCL